MSTFSYTNWLVLGKTHRAKEKLERIFCRYSGHRFEESARCSNGASVTVQDCWRADTADELDDVVGEFALDLSEIEVFCRLPGEEDAEPWSLQTSHPGCRAIAA